MLSHKLVADWRLSSWRLEVSRLSPRLKAERRLSLQAGMDSRLSCGWMSQRRLKDGWLSPFRPLRELRLSLWILLEESRPLLGLEGVWRRWAARESRLLDKLVGVGRPSP